LDDLSLACSQHEARPAGAAAGNGTSGLGAAYWEDPLEAVASQRCCSVVRSRAWFRARRRSVASTAADASGKKSEQTSVYTVGWRSADIPTDCRHLLPRLTVVASDISPVFVAHNTESVVAFSAPAEASLTEAQQLALRSDTMYPPSCDLHAFSVPPLLFVWRKQKADPDQFPSAIPNPKKDKKHQPQLGLMHQLGVSNAFRPGDFVALSAELLIVIANLDTDRNENPSQNATGELATFLNRLPGKVFRLGEKQALACDIRSPPSEEAAPESDVSAGGAKLLAPVASDLFWSQLLQGPSGDNRSSARPGISCAADAVPFDGIESLIPGPSPHSPLPPAPLPPAASSGRIAFLVVAGCGFRQTKIWQHFFDGHEDKYSLYMVRRLPRGCAKEFTRANVRYLSDRHGSDYGNLGYVKSSMALMRAALDDTVMQNERFVLFSESDVPVVSFSRLYREVMDDPYSWMSVLLPYSHRKDQHRTKVAKTRWFVMSRHRVDWDYYGKHAAQGNIMTRSLLEGVLMHDYFLLDFAPDAGAIRKYPIMQAVDEHFLLYALVASKSSVTLRLRQSMYFDWSKSNGSSPSTFELVDGALLRVVRSPELNHMFMRKVTSSTNFTVPLTDLLSDTPIVSPEIGTLDLPIVKDGSASP
jgi:hypothetical protein